MKKTLISAVVATTLALAIAAAVTPMSKIKNPSVKAQSQQCCDVPPPICPPNCGSGNAK